MITIREVLVKSQTFLEGKGVSSPRRQAEEIVSLCLQKKRIDLYMEFDQPLAEKELVMIRQMLMRRAKKEPLQYIQGVVHFFHTKLQVNPSVLIPRQETELLVEKIYNELKQNPLKNKVLWDIGTGSGAIAISLKKALPDLTVIASDLSEDALQVAKANAQAENVKIKFFKGSLFEPFQGLKADFIVSNPPYISEDEFQLLEEEVKNYEPKISLVAGKSGLEVYQSIACVLKQYLNQPAKVWLEIGYSQGEAVKEIFKLNGFDKVDFEKDYSLNDRFFSLELE